YHNQIFWVDKIDVDNNGQVWYHLGEHFSYGDVFWGPAEAFRPISREEVAPITPELTNKRIDINLARQTVSAFEDEREVFFARVSTGRPDPETETPPGNNFFIRRKMISSHLSGATSGGGWDLAGIGYTTFFMGSGIAFHSTFWHNNFGEKTSGGCINMKPEDSKWIFRWTQPFVDYDPGDVDFSGNFGGTIIRVIES
ncbi:MAG: L,D-transpeptidase, partial [Chloroflexota bacterium]